MHKVFLELDSWLVYPTFPIVLHKNYYSLKQSQVQIVQEH